MNVDNGPVSLTKGARVSLAKRGAPPFVRVTMGVGWEPSRAGRQVDLDASAIAFDAHGAVLRMVWFLQLTQYDGALVHAGDNTTGRAEGEAEQIRVDLLALPADVAAIVFTITSFRGHRFTEIGNAFCRLVDTDTGSELARFELSETEPANAVILAALRRTAGGQWEMRAIGEFYDAKMVQHLIGPAALHALAT